MDIIEKENGLFAYAKQGYVTLEFELTEDVMAQMTEGDQIIPVRIKRRSQEEL
ncbi:hypothetical protein [Salibacterium aidingense]|uniref:hypothetical protein n=1 Tax=Salibacterium aidingense TaxID=384933 RepID=UPI0003F8DDFF|nr:hypothetical protein [Salibacterium aidingense]